MEEGYFRVSLAVELSGFGMLGRRREQLEKWARVHRCGAEAFGLGRFQVWFAIECWSLLRVSLRGVDPAVVELMKSKSTSVVQVKPASLQVSVGR